ncbi:hypothetical protein K9N68_01405 [Kovacikia minuta CCNUW1]|uniref:hypothetical protein n=1 Tax=Kovacikia minuta TaxID=2931930 RepID=UPI001CCD2635|nr:hypothetical protein [Kovacikia minuta]UBF26690.1 hypothetical protein K9N68_01405 [Kovacikia minuta CCNUW1]
MATDYIFFIHGVNTREKSVFHQNAQILFDRIQSSTHDPSRTLKPVYLFWGDVSAKGTDELLKGLKASPKWTQFWFQNLRTEQILPFVGDAALYLSRGVSAQIVRQIADQALCQMGVTLEDLKTPRQGDRLHLVTHSWGTVILFDVLFAPRWEANDVDLEIRQTVENIRTGFFGLGTADNKSYGIPLGSIHTMGSPISLFSLINLNDGHSFNLTPKLKELLESIYKPTGKPLPWRNYAHPGDPIAYPLEGVMPLLLRESSNKVEIEDIISLTNPLMQPFSQSLLPLLSGGEAHGSYWKSKEVAKTIAEVIQPGR